MLQARPWIKYIAPLLLLSFALHRYFASSTTMSKQTALIVSQIGGRVEEVSDWLVPQPAPKQVQIRVTVAALNPHDQKIRDNGLFIKDSVPAILGSDITGVVTIVGPEVTKFKAGDRIVSQSRIDGNSQKALQQYAVVDEQFSSKIPAGFSDHDAASLPTNAAAALIALFDESGLGIPAPWSSKAEAFDYVGTALLVLGGGSNCGRFGVQLAKLAGIGKIVVVGGSEEELRRYGATHILNRHDGNEAVLERIRDVVGDDLVYAFDAINLPTEQHLAISALSNSKNGTLARLRFSVGAINESKIIGEKRMGYEAHNVLGLSHIKHETAKPFWDRVEGYLKNGSLLPLRYAIVDSLDANRVNELLDRYRDGKRVIQTHFRVSE